MSFRVCLARSNDFFFLAFCLSFNFFFLNVKINIQIFFFSLNS